VKIECRHGYFFFHETKAGEISRFMSYYQGLDIVPIEDRFTFSFLKAAPNYSLKGAKYLGALSSVTIADVPSEVMRANKLVYNFQTGLVVPIAQIITRTQITEAGNYFVSPGLILPGSLTDRGKRVTDYAAWYSFRDGQFEYSEVTLG
jgi:hypothetical protein